MGRPAGRFYSWYSVATGRRAEVPHQQSPWVQDEEPAEEEEGEGEAVAMEECAAAKEGQVE